MFRSGFCRSLALATGLSFSLWVSAEVQLTDNFSVSGEVRGRYESLDGQFRSEKAGSDQLLLFRSLLHGKYSVANTEFGFELQDSRTYLSDSQTPLSSSFTNAVDVLQAYYSIKQLPGLLGQGSKQKLTLGRQTVSIGSKRQIERVSFANVIKSYTGVYSVSNNADGDELHGFYLVPIQRRPSVKNDIKDNKIELDKEEWHRRLWGLHYRNNSGLHRDLYSELFAYGFDETDRGDKATANRHYLTLGGRLFKKWQKQSWNYDIEVAHRTGSRHASSDSDDQVNLSVDANMALLRLGYTFADQFNTNLALQYYYTSGDKDPQDSQFDQFERMFGGRRTDLNNTSIHGPLTPANLSALGARLELRPEANWDARIHYSAAYLSSATDGFIIAKYRDKSGESGDFIGHTLDSRYRYWWQNKTWVFELGLSVLLPGSYLDKVRAEEGLNAATTKFGYLQLAYSF